MDYDTDDVVQEDFAGKPFSAVFCRPRNAAEDKWRICRSGGRWDWGPAGRAVLLACGELGIKVANPWGGSPVGVDTMEIEAAFLDGGLTGETGNYWCGQRGAWIRGKRAVLLIALQIGLKVRPGWLREQGLEGVTLEALRAELTKGSQRRR
jgi:hypothetical protein